MQNFILSACLILLMCINVNAVRHKQKKSNLLAIQTEEKLRQKRLLQQDIYRIRLAKRREQLSEAISHEDLEKVELLLSVDIPSIAIDINEKVYWRDLDGLITLILPIILAAVIYPNLDMVKLLIRKGAKIVFSDGSLAYHMLLKYYEDKNFWILNRIFTKNTEDKMYKYLSVLRYLLKHYDLNVDKDEDTERCVLIWSDILKRVEEEEVILRKKTLRMIQKVSEVV